MKSFADQAGELRAKFEAAPVPARVMLAPYIVPMLDLFDRICARLDEPEQTWPPK